MIDQHKVMYPPSAAITPSTKPDPYVTQNHDYDNNRVSAASDDIRLQKANLDDSISYEDTTGSFESSQKKKKDSVSDPSDVEVMSSTKTKTQMTQPSTVVLGSSGAPQAKASKKARAPLHKRSADPLPSPPPTPNSARQSMPQVIHASATGNVVYTPSGGRKLNPQAPFNVSDSSGPEMASSPRTQPKRKHHIDVTDTAPRKPPYVYPVSSNPAGEPVAKRQPPYVYPRGGYDSRVQGSPASSQSGRRYDGYR